jgi:alpha-galactosidase
VNDLPITFDEKEKTFHLTAKNTSYVFKIVKSGILAHLYWGKKIRKLDSDKVYSFVERPSFSPNPFGDDPAFSLDTLPQEYPLYGTSDYRHPILETRLSDGSSISNLRYRSHKIFSGKPKIEKLPSTYATTNTEATTLQINLEDQLTGLCVDLFYSVFENFDSLTRWCVIKNNGKEAIRLERALSSSIDIPHAHFDLIHLNGAWGRERHVKRTSLPFGNTSIESRRGASGHHQNPFIVLLEEGATEDFGNVYGFSLVYSGNFIAQCEVDPYQFTRVSLGINPFDFSWLLKPTASFSTPEVVMVFSSQGLGQMSRTYHDLYRTNLCRGAHKDLNRPILINNWEATYFDFTAQKIEEIGSLASKLGMELFVLDDGWFGKRNNDKSSLGDWFVNKEKLPGGLSSLAKKINALGLKFGLWFEPEMISPDSKLYQEHPNWCLHVKNRNRTLGRNQLILDFSRIEVRERILQMITNILDAVPVDYIKWDMNRNMTEIGSLALPPESQRETAHRYILGLYEILETLTTKYPHILFESCSGGGGRFDPGMIFYMPQTWTSDNTDAVERLKIQYGTSLVYPLITMGSHVSAIPNHQVHRNTPLETRGHVAMFGNFGYELDITKSTPEEQKEIKNQVALYHQIKNVIHFGDFYRLLSPFEGNETAWMSVSKDQTTAVVSYFRILSCPTPPITRLRCKGLSEIFDYKIIETGEVLGGDMLMHAGITLPILQGDFKSILFRLEKI